MIVTTTTKKQFDTIEKESLEAHVEMCAHRHLVLERQIATVEKAVNDISVRSRDSKMLVIKSVGVTTAVLSALLSGIIFLMDRMH